MRSSERAAMLAAYLAGDQGVAMNAEVADVLMRENFVERVGDRYVLTHKGKAALDRAAASQRVRRAQVARFVPMSDSRRRSSTPPTGTPVQGGGS